MIIFCGQHRTLRELEQLLLAVDDPQRALRRPLANVARVEPAILVQHLRSMRIEGLADAAYGSSIVQHRFLHL